MKSKIILTIIMAFAIMLIAGCSKEIKDIEKYEEKATKYLSEKYDEDFDVLESYINNDNGQHVVVLTNNDGILTNVNAKIDEPYDFSDDYANALASYELKDNIDTSFLEGHGIAKLYVNLKTENKKNPDVSLNNIKSSTLVIGIYNAPGDLVVRNLYDLYKEFTAYNYNNATMIVMFAEKSENFENCINNFNTYTEIGNTKEIKTLYKTVNIKESNLNLDNFKKLFKP